LCATTNKVQHKAKSNVVTEHSISFNYLITTSKDGPETG
jgi:hypothetical protein